MTDPAPAVPATGLSTRPPEGEEGGEDYGSYREVSGEAAAFGALDAEVQSINNTPG